MNDGGRWPPEFILVMAAVSWPSLDSLEMSRAAFDQLNSIMEVDLKFFKVSKPESFPGYVLLRLLRAALGPLARGICRASASTRSGLKFEGAARGELPEFAASSGSLNLIIRC